MVHSVPEGDFTIDSGSSYAACKTATDVYTPDYEGRLDGFLEPADCPAGQTYVSSTDPDTVSPTANPTGVVCGQGSGIDLSCVAKFHKFTGRPEWASTMPQARAMEAGVDGPIITGSNMAARGSFDGQFLPDRSVYVALVDTDTGLGVYAEPFFDQGTIMWSYGMTKDESGDMYIVAAADG